MRAIIVGAIALLIGPLASRAAAAPDDVKWKRVVPKPPPKQKLTRPPRVTTFVKALYPKAALAKGISGSVRLVIVIDEKGRVIQAKIERDPGYGMGQAALEAVKTFVFSPALVNGKPARVRLRYTYHFRVERRIIERPKPPTPTGTELRGRLLERGTRLPIEAAAVAIPALKLEVRTDSNGRFRFQHLPPGRHQLVVFSVRHRNTKRSFVIGPGQRKLQLVVRADKLVAGPYEIIVIGRRPVRGISRKTLQKEELRSVPGTFGDPLRAIQTFPGVARPPFLIGILVVRGATPGDSSVFVDGHEVPVIYHFLGGPSILNPSFLERIDFFPGNFSVRYGRTLTGIIDVQTTRPKRKKWGGDVNINLFDTGVYVSGPISKKVSIALSARRSYIDLILPLVLKGDRFATVLPVYYDYQLRLDVDLKGDDYFSFFAFGSDDLLRLVTRSKDARNSLNLDSHIGFHRINAKWLANIGTKWRFLLSPILGLDITRFENDSGTQDQIGFDLLVWELGLRFDVTHYLSKTLRFDFGLDFLYRRTVATSQITTPPDYRPPPGLWFSNTTFGGGEVQSIKRSIDSISGALYFEATYKPFSWWSIVPGVRLTYYHTPANDRARLDPRLNMNFKLTKAATLKLGVGLFSQPAFELFLDKTFGNPQLKPSWAEHYSIGAEYAFTRYFRIELVAFYLHFHDPIQQSRQIVTDSSGIPRALKFSQSGDGESYGLELLIRHDPYKWFYGWISYTLMRNLETERDGRKYVLGPFDQTHILNIVASFRLGRGWELGMRFRAVTGRPETRVVGGTFSGDSATYLRLITERRNARRGFFHQLDLRV
ncbi:MAG: TonB-dependent receptor [Myxococcales bacterium]|nr:TonB-dependent receptor [Myxococcales bacterium]